MIVFFKYLNNLILIRVFIYRSTVYGSDDVAIEADETSGNPFTLSDGMLSYIQFNMFYNSR